MAGKSEIPIGEYKIIVFEHEREYFATMWCVKNTPDVKRPNIQFTIVGEVRNKDDIDTLRHDAREEARRLGINFVRNLDEKN